MTDDHMTDERVTPVPGEVLVADDPIENNPGREVRTLRVENTGDRPVQVGSHLHLAEANAALAMDREAAWGRRLAVPAGTSVRFEPGVAQEVGTVAIGGRRIVAGARGLVGGRLDGLVGGRLDRLVGGRLDNLVGGQLDRSEPGGGA